MQIRKMAFVTTLIFFWLIAMRVSAGTSTLYVDSTTITQGSISSQSLSVLNVAQQSGTADDWATYIEAAPDNQRFIGEFKFTYTPVSSSEVLEQLVVKANTLGEGISNQRWFFQIRNNNAGTWELLGDNTNANAWVWFQQAFSITANPQHYINTNGEIRIRYRSNNAYDVSNVDFLAVEVTTEESTGGGGDDGDWWKPSPTDNLTWQWQISGTLDTSLDVDMYDVDLFDTSAAQIQSLQSAGRIVVCYFSAGTYEGWRPDWQEFFPFITGESYSGSEPPFAGNMAEWDERWLDIRRIDLLGPIMRDRLDLAVAKGCDGVEPDNMDAYTNLSEVNLPLTYQDQITYNRWIAQEAHARGLSVGLKNDVDQLADLVDYFDWALNEQCFQYNECNNYSIFTNAGKAVFGVEYQGSVANFCPQANAMQLFWLKKKLSLDAWRVGCENY